MGTREIVYRQVTRLVTREVLFGRVKNVIPIQLLKGLEVYKQVKTNC